MMRSAAGYGVSSMLIDDSSRIAGSFTVASADPPFAPARCDLDRSRRVRPWQRGQPASLDYAVAATLRAITVEAMGSRRGQKTLTKIW
jgi:hypothetical protein